MEELKDYQRLGEGEYPNTDHRHRGRVSELFLFNPETPGQVTFLPKGLYIFQKLKEFIRYILNKYDFQEISTPTIVSSELWNKSGHLKEFKKNMFSVDSEEQEAKEYLRPMSCLNHMLYFNNRSVHEKDLPYRVAEFGSCYRNEASGGLLGMKRLRNFTQDDGHIFCTSEQIEEEIDIFFKMVEEVYSQLSMILNKNYTISFSSKSDEYLENNKKYKEANDIMVEYLDKKFQTYTKNDKEGAFYGPKIEIVIKDAKSKEWQCGTLQLDLILAEKMGVTYKNKEDKKQHPVVIHRAILGSLERFMALCLESTRGYLSVWLLKYQVVIIPIKGASMEWVEKVREHIDNLGYRVLVEEETINLSPTVKKYIKLRVPQIIYIGSQESATKFVTLKRYAHIKHLDATLTLQLHQLSTYLLKGNYKDENLLFRH